jgi:hypothetical protein
MTRAWDINEVIVGVSVGSNYIYIYKRVMLIDGLDLSGSRIRFNRQDHV